MQAAAMVFELVSNVYERNSVDIIPKTTKLYKPLQIDLAVENGFPQDVLFNVQILYERSAKAGAAQKGAKDAKGSKQTPKDDKKGTKGAPAGSFKDPKQAGVIPDPYHCKVE